MAMEHLQRSEAGNSRIISMDKVDQRACFCAVLNDSTNHHRTVLDLPYISTRIKPLHFTYMQDLSRFQSQSFVNTILCQVPDVTKQYCDYSAGSNFCLQILNIRTQVPSYWMLIICLATVIVIQCTLLYFSCFDELQYHVYKEQPLSGSSQLEQCPGFVNCL